MALYNEISVSTLARLVGVPQCPVLLDVRTNQDSQADPRSIPSSYRYDYLNVADLAEELSDKSVIVYCQKGLKISQGAAAILRCKGINTEVLQGGHSAWSDANLPMHNTDKPPVADEQGRTIWVTRHRPKIDRIACPWLIRRFIDQKAQFLFVAPSQVGNVAKRFKATPFDVQDVFWSHRGENCTFDTMIEEFGIQNDALARLATVVRGADTDKHDLAPEAVGLLAVSLGLSRMFRDDLTQLEAGFMLYDAFYLWARDAINEGTTGQQLHNKTICK